VVRWWKIKDINSNLGKVTTAGLLLIVILSGCAKSEPLIISISPISTPSETIFGIGVVEMIICFIVGLVLVNQIEHMVVILISQLSYIR
jgi:hypothetical protein